jgi:hypothetical protein
MSYEGMKASIARHKNAKATCDTVAFKDPRTVREIHAALGRAIRQEDEGLIGPAKLVIRSGRKEDGAPESWAEVPGVGAFNASTNCPPFPPEDCE